MTLNMKTFIKTGIASFALSGGISMTTLSAAGIAIAAEPRVAVAMTETAPAGNFEKKSFGIQGEWEIIKENGQTIFRISEDFKTKNGPDLKLFLSPNSVATATGATATHNAIRLGALKTNRGGQDYVIPSNIELSEFGSILIHCEAFSKLWGGANL